MKSLKQLVHNFIWTEHPGWLLLGGVLSLGVAIESGDLLFLPFGLFLIAKGAEELLRPQHQPAANILLALSKFTLLVGGSAVILSWFLR